MSWKVRTGPKPARRRRNRRHSSLRGAGLSKMRSGSGNAGIPSIHLGQIPRRACGGRGGVAVSRAARPVARRRRGHGHAVRRYSRGGLARRLQAGPRRHHRRLPGGELPVHRAARLDQHGDAGGPRPLPRFHAFGAPHHRPRRRDAFGAPARRAAGALLDTARNRSREGGRRAPQDAREPRDQGERSADRHRHDVGRGGALQPRPALPLGEPALLRMGRAAQARGDDRPAVVRGAGHGCARADPPVHRPGAHRQARRVRALRAPAAARAAPLDPRDPRAHLRGRGREEGRGHRLGLGDPRHRRSQALGGGAARRARAAADDHRRHPGRGGPHRQRPALHLDEPGVRALGRQTRERARRALDRGCARPRSDARGGAEPRARA